jgi:hypothetical protein
MKAIGGLTDFIAPISFRGEDARSLSMTETILSPALPCWIARSKTKKAHTSLREIPMSRRSFFFALPLLAAACAGPVDQDASEATLADELTSGATYVRITGTCFQSYDMKAVNTGVTLGASKLVFKPGEEDKQFAFCAGTDRVILRGNKTADGNFAVENVWMQQSGEVVAQDVEIVRALKRESGEMFERSLNGNQVRRVSFQLGSQSLSETSAQQLATGRILFAGPRSGSTGGTGGYGQQGASTSTRRVDAIFQEME